MKTLEDLKTAIKDKLCDKKHTIVGLVEETRSRDGIVLRRLNAMGNFNPIAYQRELLVFFVMNGSVTIDKARSLPLKITMVILTDDYNDLALIIEALDEYDFLPVEATFDSQNTYNKYFDTDPNKPFQGYGFEIDLNVRVNYKELLF